MFAQRSFILKAGEVLGFRTMATSDEMRCLWLCVAPGQVCPGKESEVSRKRELEALPAAQKEEVSWQKEGRVNGGRVECIFSDVLDL